MHTRITRSVPVAAPAFAIVVFGLGGLPPALIAATPDPGGTRKAPRIKYITTEEYDSLKREISELKTQVQTLMKSTGAQPPRHTTAPGTEAEGGGQAATQQVRPTPTPAASAQAAPAPEKSQGITSNGLAEGDRKQEAEQAQQQLDTFLRAQKLLFKKGELQGEVNASYTSDVQVNNCVRNSPYECIRDAFGRVQLVPRIASRGADINLIARYGLMDNMEFDVFVPFSYLEQEDSQYLYLGGVNSGFREGDIRRREYAGLGDVSAALRYAVWREDGTWPDVTLSLDVKSATGDTQRNLGTGFWNIGGSVTLVKTVDPVVLFGSFGYVASLEQRGINPGDQIPYSFGMGFSLNDRVSFKISLAGSVVRGTQINGQTIPSGSGYDISTLQFSTTILRQKNLFFEPFVGFGLTEESPDFFAGIRIPYKFTGNYPLPFLN